jgi:hypothetical protein
VDYGGALEIVPAFKDPVKEGTSLLNRSDSLTQMVVEEHRRDLKRGK